MDGKILELPLPSGGQTQRQAEIQTNRQTQTERRADEYTNQPSHLPEILATDEHPDEGDDSSRRQHPFNGDISQTATRDAHPHRLSSISNRHSIPPLPIIVHLSVGQSHQRRPPPLFRLGTGTVREQTVAEFCLPADDDRSIFTRSLVNSRIDAELHLGGYEGRRGEAGAWGQMVYIYIQGGPEKVRTSLGRRVT